MKINYSELSGVISSLCSDESDAVALMATIVCEVHHGDTRFDWTGFYRVTEPGLLKIGPYQGGQRRFRAISPAPAAHDPNL